MLGGEGQEALKPSGDLDSKRVIHRVVLEVVNPQNGGVPGRKGRGTLRGKGPGRRDLLRSGSWRTLHSVPLTTDLGQVLSGPQFICVVRFSNDAGQMLNNTGHRCLIHHPYFPFHSGYSLSALTAHPLYKFSITSKARLP